MTQESSWQQAGQIIELTQGYVLDWRGSSYACDSLDAVVAVLAKVGQSHRKPWPVPTHAADGSAPGIDAASPTDLPAALVAGDGQSLLHAAPTPEQAIANAQTLARALV